MSRTLVPLLVLVLAACGPTRATEDGDTTPDAGTPAPDAGTTAATPTFDDVYALFVNRCDGCHSPGSDSGSLDLSTRDTAYAQLVNRTSEGPMCGQTPHTLVVPGHHAESLLYTKLAGTAGCGFRMPQGREGPGPGPRPQPFTDEEMSTVAGWIDAGARNDHATP